MEIMNWVLIGVIAFVVLIAVIMTIVAWRKKKKTNSNPENQKVDDVVEIKGVRYTEDQSIVEESGEMRVSFGKEDIVISAHTTMKAEKNGKLMPGKYTVLSTAEDVEKFNVRLGKFVRECKHGDVIVLAEGDEITPTSHTIILR